MTGLGVRRWIGFVAGMALTSASLSSGFIWACGSPCATWGLLWTPDLQLPLVFGAALAAWWGYLVAHYAVAGTFVDESTHGVDGDGRSEFDRSNPGRMRRTTTSACWPGSVSSCSGWLSASSTSGRGTTS